MRTAKILTWTAFGLTMALAAAGILFIAGETLADPGGWTAAGMIAAWLLPMIGLVALVLWRPTVAGWVLAGLVVVVAALNLADWVLGPAFRQVGPIPAISLFGVGIPLGVLGLRRARLAGVLLLAASLLQYLTLAIALFAREGTEGPGPGALLGGSSGVLIVPFLVVGVLYFVAGTLAHQPLTTRRDGHLSLA